MAISKDHTDIAMHYEELATKVFDCDRFEDPWGYADAGSYDAYFVEPGIEAKMRLYTIIDIAINDNQGEDVLIEALLEIKSRITEMNSQDDAISIIQDTIDLMNENGY